MTLYEDTKPFMDAQVDNALGDSIVYKINGAVVPGATNAFLLDYSDDGGGMQGMQPLANRWRLKIKKELLPERPGMRHEVAAAKLDGRYRPAVNNPTDGGDYWIVDLQKAA